MLYNEFKNEVLRLYYMEDMKTIDIALKLDVEREDVLDVIKEDYLATFNEEA